MYPGSLSQKLTFLTSQLESPKDGEKMMKRGKGLGRKGAKNFRNKNDAAKNKKKKASIKEEGN